jgi:hypothetical protein
VLKKASLEPVGQPYLRRGAQVKAEVLPLVERSPLPVRQTLKELRIVPTTYYRWRGTFAQPGLDGLAVRPPGPKKVWNRPPQEEGEYVVR